MLNVAEELIIILMVLCYTNMRSLLNSAMIFKNHEINTISTMNNTRMNLTVGSG